jgi:hypothetical protein
MLDPIHHRRDTCEEQRAMDKIAGVVLDIYDDLGALLTKVGSALPSELASLQMLDRDQRARLPDNAFAGVLINGDERMRKYACHDPGHTMLSCAYFHHTHDALPRHAQTKIAANLLSACRAHGLEPPLSIRKLATKKLIQSDGAEMVIQPGEKRSELVGTRIMPQTPVAPTRKLASMDQTIEDPYVEVTGHDVIKEAEHLEDHWYALVSDQGDRQFPLVSYRQVKEAADYFDQNYRHLHPRTRRSFCEKLAARAHALGFPLSKTASDYGADGYRDIGGLKVAFQLRKRLWRDGANESVSLLDELLEKQASLEPDTFAEVLAQLDIMNHADRLWDTQLPDPWETTFGQPKVAAWRWEEGNSTLEEPELKQLVTVNKPVMVEHFGQDAADEMEKSPVAIFESMPLVQKRLIAQLAQAQTNT